MQVKTTNMEKENKFQMINRYPLNYNSFIEYKIELMIYQLYHEESLLNIFISILNLDEVLTPIILFCVVTYTYLFEEGKKCQILYLLLFIEGNCFDLRLCNSQTCKHSEYK